MPRLALPALLALLSLAACAAAAERAAPKSEAAKAEFLRVLRDDDGEPISLDTSIVEYRETAAAAAQAGRKTPLQVDLVAAVHVGGADYYQTLDRMFVDYDAVLYELVAPPNARVPKPGRKPAGAIGSAQQGLRQMLGLEFQLEGIDYSAANFVHADLSPKEFDAAMAKRGETWWSMFSRLMRESMARADRAGGGGDVSVGELFGILFGSGPERQARLRRMMAEQFTDMEVLTAAFGGEEGSTLITDRNAAALMILRDQIAKGRRRIAIFYGAAHMDDFDERLREDFGLQPGEPVWLEAWDLRAPEPEPARK
ncbi:MAG: hypothetical protein K8S94_10945 [Planctomycetia bacterium]|nr:hypothetical protein [Planctomycetia bacterium]